MFQPQINTDKVRETINKKPARTQTEFKKRWMNPFWEQLRIGKSIEQLIFVAPEQGYVSAVNGTDVNYWFEGWKHKGFFLQNGKENYPWITCSEGHDPSNKQPCIGCFYYSAFYKALKKGEKKQNPWKKQLFAVFNVIHLAWYKKVIRVDKDGKPVTFNDVPQYNIIRCPQGEEGSTDSFFGRLLKLDVSNMHFKAILNFDDKLYWTCDGCNTGIRTHRIYCSKCGEDFVDINKVSSRVEQQKLLRSPQTCSCGEVALPIEDTECGYNEEGTMKLKTRQAQKGGTPRATCPLDKEPPRRMGLFSSILNIKKEGEGKDSNLKVTDHFSFDINSDISWPIPDGFPPVGEIVDSILQNTKMYDMKEYVPIEIEEQARELHVENPYIAPKDLPDAGKIDQNPIPVKEETPTKTFKIGIKFPSA